MELTVTNRSRAYPRKAGKGRIGREEEKWLTDDFQYVVLRVHEKVKYCLS